MVRMVLSTSAPSTPDLRPFLSALALLAILALGARLQAAEDQFDPTVLAVPRMTDESPAAGKFVRQIAAEYQGTGVYHALYLPSDWQPGRLYPVIVEYAGNQSGLVCTGRVEDCRMGHGMSGGKGYLWIVLPYVNETEKKNQLTWWGDAAATRTYCRTNLKRICQQYGGDPSAVFLTGFSRGAIAGGYIGLGDEATSDLWLAFLPFSHHDAGSFTREGGRERLARIRGRASFLTYGSHDGGRANTLLGGKILAELGFPVMVREIPDTAHTDRWIAVDSPIRREMRSWMADVLARRPGTQAIRGRVTSVGGAGVPGVRITAGETHWTTSDADGNYEIKGLVAGPRMVTAVKEGLKFEPAERRVELRAEDVAGVDFAGR